MQSASVQESEPSVPSRRSRPSRGRADRSRRGGARVAPASAAAHQSPSPSQPGEAIPNAPSQATPEARHGRGRGGGRPQGRGRGRGQPAPRGRGAGRGQPHTPVVSATRRTFGGHLTTEDQDATSESSTSLNADASVFVPGRPVQQQRDRKQQSSRARPSKGVSLPSAPKSTAPDLPTRIHDDINNGQYECVICTSEVLRASRVWSCSVCWTVAHLPCVAKWYDNRKKTQDESSDSTQDTQWRCPGCNSELLEGPGVYHCWCGKEVNPKSVPGLPPHSCGQTCARQRKACPHPCPLECHAGPCPPCDRMGPPQPCFCGKEIVTKRCHDTNYDGGWSCAAPCGDLLACGEHTCERPCHSGFCGTCDVPMLSRCYCGKVEKEIPCEKRDEVKLSFSNKTPLRRDDIDLPESPDLVSSGVWFDGSFDCGDICGRPFDCGRHTCQKTCHVQDEEATHCPLSPDVVTLCPCGKTELSSLPGPPRQSCEDEIPRCEKTCGKLLDCGHTCLLSCHGGPCGPCPRQSEVRCRCGRTTEWIDCAEPLEEPPRCARVCQTLMSCGRHQCQERCCPSEKQATERMAAKRRNKQAGHDEDFEALHVCIRTCGRKLKCGNHTCPQPCHRGPCNSCREAIFEEIACACGRTVLQPPQPCGTQPPECSYDCTKVPQCGHPRVSHTCHSADSPCPKCPFLVEKECVCTKKILKNQPCWIEEVHCGLPCGKKLKCGAHTCQKPCHRDGECEDASIKGTHCLQVCGKTKKFCDHACQNACHAPYACKEDKPCQGKVTMACECRRKKQEVKCGVSATSPWPPGRGLKCDDECLRLLRNERLAAALNISNDHQDDFIPYSDETLDFFRENKTWASAQEKEFKSFADNSDERRLRFKPMAPHLRAFIHLLATDYGFESESQDPPPHRHVCIYKTPRFVSAPMKSLAEASRARATQANETAKAAAAAYSAAEAALSLEPINAIVLNSPKFGLTIDDISVALATDFASNPSLKFSIHFLPSDQVVLQAASKNFASALTAQGISAALERLKPAVESTVSRTNLATSIFLAHVNPSLEITRRERATGNAAGVGGWSAVVGRAAKTADRKILSATPSEPQVTRTFVGLRKKKVVEPVEDDWQTAAEKADATDP